uniref:Uncharacterized protein n=1 Tax=viral metagenome TaxID=1070528 RepID=A0A6M3JFD0_9ZZZZ
MAKIKKFNIVRVVTRDIITDAFQGLRNFFGLRLRGYESVLDKHIKLMTREMELKYDVKWFRLIVNPLTNGSAMIILYGEGIER